MNNLPILHVLVQNTFICVPIEFVSKVLSLPLLEAVPGSPPYLTGLMNLEGKSIPVIDLATRVGLKREERYTVDTPILLCFDDKHEAGLVIDKVLQLATIEEKDYQMRSEFNDPASPFLASIPFNNALSLLINMNKVLEVSFTLQCTKIYE